MHVTFKCDACGNSAARYRVEDALIEEHAIGTGSEMPCPTCMNPVEVTEVTFTVPPRDDDVQAVLEAWPEVRRLVLALVGDGGDLYDTGTITRLRDMVEKLPQGV